MFAVNEINYENVPGRQSTQMQQEYVSQPIIEKKAAEWSPVSSRTKQMTNAGWNASGVPSLHQGPDKNLNTPTLRKMKNFVDLSESPTIPRVVAPSSGVQDQAKLNSLLQSKNVNNLLVMNSIDQYAHTLAPGSRDQQDAGRGMISEAPRRNNFRPGGRGPRLSGSPLVDRDRETLTLEAVSQYIYDHFENPRTASPTSLQFARVSAPEVSSMAPREGMTLKRGPTLSPWVNPKIEADAEKRVEDMSITPKLKKPKGNFSPITKTGSTMESADTAPRLGKACFDIGSDPWKDTPFTAIVQAEAKKEEMVDQWSPEADRGTVQRKSSKTKSAKKNPFGGIEACLTSVKVNPKSEKTHGKEGAKRQREGYIPQSLESLLS